MSNNIIDAIISDEFIDKLFKNEYFIKKIEALIKKKLLQERNDIKIYCYNDNDILFTYDEFLSLNEKETLSFFEKNNFNEYTHFILQACQDNKLSNYHIKSRETINFLLENNCKINNIFELHNNKSISYHLIENLIYYNLLFGDIIRLVPESYYKSNTITLTDYYYLMKDDLIIKRNLFKQRNYEIDFYKNIKFDIIYLRNIINSHHYYNSDLDDITESIIKYNYPKISAFQFMSLFEKKNEKWYLRTICYNTSNLIITRISTTQSPKIIKLAEICDYDDEIINLINFCNKLDY